MKAIIRLGDPTDHGGQVVASGAPYYLVEGSPIALLGDPCSCPKRGHHNCVIAEGDPNHLVNGIPVAYAGHKTSCGATLIATIQTCGRS
jgi:uncharacterized Zn-binding protein involved in type VI secretion